MARRIRFFGLTALVFLACWTVGSLVDLWSHSGASFWDIILHPRPHQALGRLLIGLVLATGLYLFLMARQRHLSIQKELSQQRDFYKNVTESSPGCIMVQVDEAVVFANARCREFFGWSDADVARGPSAREVVIPEDREKVDRHHQELMAGLEAGTLELSVQHAFLGTRQIQSISRRIHFQGKIGVLSVFHDVTEEMKSKQEIVANSERLQLALEAARDGVWDWDIVTGKMVYSESWAKMLGYDLDEITDNMETWRNLIHPGDYLRAQTLVDNHLEGFVPGYEIEVRLRHKKGHYIWVLDRGRVVERDDRGNPRRMTGTHRDITARKEAELALEIRNRVAEAFLISESDNLFAEILVIICSALDCPVGIFTTLGSQNDLHVVASHPDLAGTSGSEDNILSFPSNHLPDVFEVVVNQGRFFLRNEPLEIASHQLSLESMLGVPIKSRRETLGAIFLGNKVGGFEQSDRSFLESLAGYIAPILQSHLNSAAKEFQLRQAQKMEALGSLAGGIAHDFNNILQAIMGFSTLALENADTKGNLRGDLERVLKATRRGQELVQRILLFSRREEQKKVPLEIQTVVQEAINLLKPSIPASVQIRSDLQAAGAHVFGDPSQINQVVLNLATNAYHAMQAKGGLLEIRLKTLGGQDQITGRPDKLVAKDLIVLTISDTGVGMSEMVKARLFDPFFTTKEVGQGTGLGMSMVHGIVQAHGGEIQIHSELEIGTTVTVLLPLYQEPPEADRSAKLDSPPKHHEVSGAGWHVALVDDEQDITDLGRALLQRAGYQVTTENSGGRLLDLLEKDPNCFDLVITDLTMPQISGVQLARRIFQLNPRLPILLITGMTEEDKLDFSDFPAIKGLVRKPFSREVLLVQVDGILKEFAFKRES